jgi:hypothetical protein
MMVKLKVFKVFGLREDEWLFILSFFYSVALIVTIIILFIDE